MENKSEKTLLTGTGPGFCIDILSINIVLLFLCFASAICGTMLGKLGGYLTDAILPGK